MDRKTVPPGYDLRLLISATIAQLGVVLAEVDLAFNRHCIAKLNHWELSPRRDVECHLQSFWFHSESLHNLDHLQRLWKHRRIVQDDWPNLAQIKWKKLNHLLNPDMRWSESLAKAKEKGDFSPLIQGIINRIDQFKDQLKAFIEKFKTKNSVKDINQQIMENKDGNIRVDLIKLRQDWSDIDRLWQILELFFMDVFKVSKTDQKKADHPQQVAANV